MADEPPIQEVDYVAEAGPGIPELPPGEPVVEQLATEDQTPAYPGWEEETVEQFLKGTGAGLHLLLGAGETDWYMTRTDLDRIAPPLTRILNRYEPSLRASEYADPLLVAHGFGLYGWRSVLAQRQAVRRREQAEREQDGYVEPGQEPEEAQEEVTDAIEVQPGPDDYIPYAQRRRPQ